MLTYAENERKIVRFSRESFLCAIAQRSKFFLLAGAQIFDGLSFYVMHDVNKHLPWAREHLKVGWKTAHYHENRGFFKIARNSNV